MYFSDEPTLEAITFKSVFEGVKKAVTKFDSARAKLTGSPTPVAPSASGQLPVPTSFQAPAGPATFEPAPGFPIGKALLYGGGALAVILFLRRRR